MRSALTQSHHEDRRSGEKRSCKRGDNTERPIDQNASALIWSVAALSCWRRNSLSLLAVLSFFTLFYGNGGTKFPKSFQKKRSQIFICTPNESAVIPNGKTHVVSSCAISLDLRVLSKSDAPRASIDQTRRKACAREIKDHYRARPEARDPRVRPQPMRDLGSA